jgi:hypothetical protein
MGQTCTKCSRVNPKDAAYCYHDGAVLAGHSRNGGPVAVGAAPFLSPFVFPSGRQCRTFDELVMACQHDWGSARDLLTEGFFESFFGGLGRADLAQAAREAARFPDHDRGLDQLLGNLPSRVVEPPRLFVAPQEVSLGTLKVGQDGRCELHLENRGMRLLYGSVTCDECDWLALGDAPGAPEKLFQFGAEATIPIHVKGKRLRAGNKPLEGRLSIESNGGAVVVTVRAEVPPKPFPDGVLKGALTPRQVAEKAKAAPKEAAALFEKGNVAEWYRSNGWIYPVQGPSASGLGAVQQFFEALGLTPPPKVAISERSVTLQAAAGASVRHALEVKSEEKRPVYAHASSSAPWLEVGRPKLNGRVATIPLTVPHVPDRAGETLTAKVTVQANGNQRFVVPVTLVIGGDFNFGPAVAVQPAAAPAPAPVPKKPSRPVPVPARQEELVPLIRVQQRKQGFSASHLLPLVALLLVLACVMGYDAYDAFTRNREPKDTGLAFHGDVVPDADAFNKPLQLKDAEPRVGIDFDERRRFGLVLRKEQDPQNQAKFKRLTYEEKGSTNNTCIKVDGHEYLFGNPGHGRWVKKEEKRKNNRIGYDSIFDITNESIVVTQSVDLVPGDQTMLLDTVLVRYKVENKSKNPHTVGLRVMLDTFIGANDGVPFAVPGTDDKKDRLVDTKEIFEQKDIPDYVQALERPDLKNPGTVAHVGLKIPKFEDPYQLIICRWPGNKEMKWEINPIEEMRSNAEKPDSCVVIYWAYQKMNGAEAGHSGDVRDFAFTYGLNSISGLDGGPGGDGRIALTTGGSTRPGREFTVTAYVKNPNEEQTVKLILPEGFAFAKGHQAEKKVEGVKDGLAQVSWRVRASQKEGEYTLEATSGPARATKSVRIREEGLF